MPRKPRYTREEIAMWRRMHESGMSLRQVALRVGVHPKSIGRIIDEDAAARKRIQNREHYREMHGLPIQPREEVTMPPWRYPLYLAIYEAYRK
jgi:hypothetical protein